MNAEKAHRTAFLRVEVKGIGQNKNPRKGRFLRPGGVL